MSLAIDWLGTVQSIYYQPFNQLLSERMKNSTCCTLYDRKNLSNPYNLLRITRVNALLLSVSFKPIFVDFTLVIDMLLANSCHSIVLFMFRFFYSKKDSWGLHILFKKMATVKTLTVRVNTCDKKGNKSCVVVALYSWDMLCI